jgi:hypothetical protein
LNNGSLRASLVCCHFLVSYAGFGCVYEGFYRAASNHKVFEFRHCRSSVNFTGVLTDVNKPLSGVVGVTFYLYKEE